jgi:molybdate transport system ATP-binding protein
VFRPSAVGVYRDPPGGSIRNVIPVTITELEPLGDVIRIRSAHLSADITPSSVAELDLVPGTRVLFAVKASEVAVYGA